MGYLGLIVNYPIPTFFQLPSYDYVPSMGWIAWNHGCFNHFVSWCLAYIRSLLVAIFQWYPARVESNPFAFSRLRTKPGWDVEINSTNSSWCLNHPFETYARQIRSSPLGRDENTKYFNPPHHLDLLKSYLGSQKGQDSLPTSLFSYVKLWGCIVPISSFQHDAAGGYGCFQK